MEYKQVIMVRSDLRMGGGKTCAQVAHASLSSAERTMALEKGWYLEWKKEGQKKVVVKVSSERELFEIFETAKAKGIPGSVINDAGLTELPPGTTTAVGIGPAPNDIMDRVTGHLKLLG